MVVNKLENLILKSTFTNTSKTPFNPVVSRSNPSKNFEAVLAGLSELKFSLHAKQRLSSRKVSISPAELSKLKEAVGIADLKGAENSLVLLNDKALIVSIKNKTVITVIEKQNLRENVITNIDSAVLV